jgi:carbonic anhydrase/acetyltransferase-like protein (isoleucine patch superfamily)
MVTLVPDLVCSGSHGRDISVIFQRAHPDKELRVWDDDFYPIDPDALRHVIIGINDPRERKRLAVKYPGMGPPRAIVDPSAIIGPNVTLARGVIVAPLACLLHDVDLGEHVHVNYHASMTRCTVGAYTTVSPGATICGDVEIGEVCMIGAGAVVCDRVTIGDHVTVAAGAIIPPLSVVPSGSRVIGVWKH